MKPAPRGYTLAVLLARAYPDAPPHRIAETVDLLQRTATAWRSYETRRCNEPVDEEKEKRSLETKTNRALAALSALGISATEVYIEFGGDPRGPCGTLRIGGMPGDGFGPGYGIYW